MAKATNIGIFFEYLDNVEFIKKNMYPNSWEMKFKNEHLTLIRNACIFVENSAYRL